MILLGPYSFLRRRRQKQQSTDICVVVTSEHAEREWMRVRLEMKEKRHSN
jgi:hypothetical protein